MVKKLTEKPDEFVKSPKISSPLTGEGWGKGEYNRIATAYRLLPSNPSHKGRGNKTFYDFIKNVVPSISDRQVDFKRAALARL